MQQQTVRTDDAGAIARRTTVLALPAPDVTRLARTAARVATVTGRTGIDAGVVFTHPQTLLAPGTPPTGRSTAGKAAEQRTVHADASVESKLTERTADQAASTDAGSRAQDPDTFEVFAVVAAEVRAVAEEERSVACAATDVIKPDRNQGQVRLQQAVAREERDASTETQFSADDVRVGGRPTVVAHRPPGPAIVNPQLAFERSRIPGGSRPQLQPSAAVRNQRRRRQAVSTRSAKRQRISVGNVTVSILTTDARIVNIVDRFKATSARRRTEETAAVPVVGILRFQRTLFDGPGN